MDSTPVIVPHPWRFDQGRWVPDPNRTWEIREPLLKLVLKYGIAGPWESPFNRSREFDNYTRSRGPNAGLPTITDLLVTQLMNSFVDKRDVRSIENWVEEPDNLLALRRVRDCLKNFGGLEDLPEAVFGEILAVVDSVTQIKYIKDAKAFKWLSTWAPAHIPMIDNEVWKALSDMFPDGVSTRSERLHSFKRLVTDNLAAVRHLGRRLASLLGFENFSISPTRIMDNLIWIDWYNIKSTGFADYFRFEEAATYHTVLQAGIDLMAELGIDHS